MSWPVCVCWFQAKPVINLKRPNLVIWRRHVNSTNFTTSMSCRYVITRSNKTTCYTQYCQTCSTIITKYRNHSSNNGEFFKLWWVFQNCEFFKLGWVSQCEKIVSFPNLGEFVKIVKNGEFFKTIVSFSKLWNNAFSKLSLSQLHWKMSFSKQWWVLQTFLHLRAIYWNRAAKTYKIMLNFTRNFIITRHNSNSDTQNKTLAHR